MKTVVVTGGAGFVGSHLCERLARDGYRVISLDNYFTGSKDNHVEGVEYREGHTKDIHTHIPEDPNIIYHLGEYSRVRQSFDEPHVVWDLNMQGTCAVLDFWKSKNGEKKCKLVYAGSSTKFSDTRDDGVRGKDLAPYTWSKSSMSDLVVQYGRWYDLPYVVSYFYNVYGPRELTGKYGAIIGIFKDQYKRGETFSINGPGTQMRCFTHVLDTVEGLVLAGEKGEGDEYGIGSNDCYSLIEIAEMFGGEYEIKPPTKSTRSSSEVDIDKLSKLGWKPQKNLREYIEEEKNKLTK